MGSPLLVKKTSEEGTPPHLTEGGRSGGVTRPQAIPTGTEARYAQLQPPHSLRVRTTDSPHMTLRSGGLFL